MCIRDSFGEAREIVRRVGPDEIGGGVDQRQVAECIAAHQGELVGASEEVGHFGYEPILCGCLFYCCDMGGTARQQFEGDRSCAGKKVNGVDLFKVNEVFNDIEYVFTGKVGGGL